MLENGDRLIINDIPMVIVSTVYSDNVFCGYNIEYENHRFSNYQMIHIPTEYCVKDNDNICCYFGNLVKQLADLKLYDNKKGIILIIKGSSYDSYMIEHIFFNRYGYEPAVLYMEIEK